jgi:hypothetical protein
MKKSLITAILLTFILAACPNGPAPIMDGIQYCQAAENHLKDLGCIPKDKPYTLNGKSFSVFCQETMMNGINLHPKCLYQITSCNQMNMCAQGK